MFPLFFGFGFSNSSAGANATSSSSSSATAKLFSDNVNNYFTPPGEGTHLAGNAETLVPTQGGLTTWMANMFGAFTNGLLDTSGATPANNGSGDPLTQISLARPGQQAGSSGETPNETNPGDPFIRNGARDILANMLSMGTTSLLSLYNSVQQRDYLSSFQNYLPSFFSGNSNGLGTDMLTQSSTIPDLSSLEMLSGNGVNFSDSNFL